MVRVRTGPGVEPPGRAALIHSRFGIFTTVAGFFPLTICNEQVGPFVERVALLAFVAAGSNVDAMNAAPMVAVVQDRRDYVRGDASSARRVAADRRRSCCVQGAIVLQSLECARRAAPCRPTIR